MDSTPGAPAAEPASGLAGTPDGFERLWTPHRMAYVSGDRPSDGAGQGCPFCAAPDKEDADGLLVHRGVTCYVVLNLFPYNPGHLLVCPYRHVPLYVDLSDEELTEFTALTRSALRALEAASAPAGFNLGINQGAVAGAGVAAHLHQHVVPRWGGDANFLPIVGRTKALPALLEDVRQQLLAAWPASGDGAPDAGPGRSAGGVDVAPSMSPDASTDQTGSPTTRAITLDGELVEDKSQWVHAQLADIAVAGDDTRAAQIQGRPIVVVTVRGARSGLLRQVPLMRVERDGAYLAVASKGGAPEHPAWYHSIVAHPQVDLHDGTTHRLMTARELAGEERATWWERAVADFPPYAEYQTKTERQIPILLLEG